VTITVKKLAATVTEKISQDESESINSSLHHNRTSSVFGTVSANKQTNKQITRSQTQRT